MAVSVTPKRGPAFSARLTAYAHIRRVLVLATPEETHWLRTSALKSVSQLPNQLQPERPRQRPVDTHFLQLPDAPQLYSAADIQAIRSSKSESLAAHAQEHKRRQLVAQLDGLGALLLLKLTRFYSPEDIQLQGRDIVLTKFHCQINRPYSHATALGPEASQETLKQVRGVIDEAEKEYDTYSKGG